MSCRTARFEPFRLLWRYRKHAGFDLWLLQARRLFVKESPSIQRSWNSHRTILAACAAAAQQQSQPQEKRQYPFKHKYTLAAHIPRLAGRRQPAEWRRRAQARTIATMNPRCGRPLAPVTGSDAEAASPRAGEWMTQRSGSRLRHLPRRLCRHSQGPSIEGASRRVARTMKPCPSAFLGGGCQHRLTNRMIPLGVDHFTSVLNVAQLFVLTELGLADKAGDFDL